VCLVRVKIVPSATSSPTFAWLVKMVFTWTRIPIRACPVLAPARSAHQPPIVTCVRAMVSGPRTMVREAVSVSMDGRSTELYHSHVSATVSSSVRTTCARTVLR